MSQDKTEHSIASVVEHLTTVSRGIRGNVLVFKKEKPELHSKLQVVFNTKFSNVEQQCIHEIIMTHAHAAELMGPGGFNKCLEMILEKFSLGLWCIPPQQHANKKISVLALPAYISDLSWLMEEYMPNASKKVRKMLEVAVGLAGFTGRISIEKTSNKASIELTRGYSFDQSPAWPMTTILEYPKVVCIDGFVESVGEIHHLLQQMSETKETMLLFVRGLADDVKQTLKVNYDRGTLRVVPVIVKFDLEGINSLNDISIVSGAGLVSSNKGDLISSVRLSDTSQIEKAIVYPKKVVIINSASKLSVETHVSFLRRKRVEENENDVSTLIDARIRSLSPNHVVIRLPDDIDYVVSAQSIDYALRALRSLVDHGTVTINGKRMLTSTYLASQLHSNRCSETLASLGFVVTSAGRRP